MPVVRRFRGPGLRELDGRPIAVSGGSDQTLRIWDLASRAPFGDPLRGHTHAVLALAVGELDGLPIAVSGSTDQTIRVWDLTRRAQLGAPSPAIPCQSGQSLSASSTASRSLSASTSNRPCECGISPAARP